MLPVAPGICGNWRLYRPTFCHMSFFYVGVGNMNQTSFALDPEKLMYQVGLGREAKKQSWAAGVAVGLIHTQRWNATELL